MIRPWSKGDRIRLLVPTVGGWQGEAIITQGDDPECTDGLIYFRRADDDDPDRDDGCCAKAEAEWVCSRFEADLLPEIRTLLHAYRDHSWTQPGPFRHRNGLAAVLHAAADLIVPADQSCSLDELKVQCRLRALAYRLCPPPP